MKQTILIFLISFIALEIQFAQNTVLKTNENKSELFASGLISTGLHEHSGFNISPDQKIALWTISLNGHKIILQSKQVNSTWQKPETASFSGQFRDEFHFFSPDGNTLYFNSYRPEFPTDSIKKFFLHWQVNWDGEKFSEPVRNTKWNPNLWPYSMSANHTVYGWGSFEEKRRDGDIYRQTFENGHWQDVVNLGDSINTEAVEYCPYISPNEDYLIFSRMGTNKNDGLYISLKRADGTWTKAIYLPKEINQGYAERFARVSPDGKILYFNRQVLNYAPSSDKKLPYDEIIEKFIRSPQNGNGDIYWVNTDFIQELKASYLK